MTYQEYRKKFRGDLEKLVAKYINPKVSPDQRKALLLDFTTALEHQVHELTRRAHKG